MFSVAHVIQSGGLALVALLIFGESGMFIGFFFPGDTLLISAGVFAAQGKLSLALTIIVVALAAIAGDNVGYQLGKRFGHIIFAKEDSLIFNKEYIEQAHKFFDRYGSRSMLLAHFVPVIRTFAPPVAGAAEMPIKQYVIYDAIGDTAWAALLTLIGYWFGSKIPNIDHYILLVVAVVIVITIGPAIYHFVKTLRARRAKTNASVKETSQEPRVPRRK